MLDILLKFDTNSNRTWDALLSCNEAAALKRVRHLTQLLQKPVAATPEKRFATRACL